MESGSRLTGNERIGKSGVKEKNYTRLGVKNREKSGREKKGRPTKWKKIKKVG